MLARPGVSFFTRERQMLMRICDITATVRHVELPAKCPACGKRIKNAVELNLSDGSIAGAIADADPDDDAQFEPDAQASWEHGETFIVTGYRCGRCHHVLIEGQFHEEDGD